MEAASAVSNGMRRWREVLRKAAPRGEIELGGFAQLDQITFQARAAREQLEDAVLVENVDLVFPDHVIDGREFAAIADEHGRQWR